MRERFARVARACARRVGAMVSAWARARAQVAHRRELRSVLIACAVTATGLRAPAQPQAVRREREAA